MMKAFFPSADHNRGYNLWSCQNVCDALSLFLDNIYIRFGTELYRQIVGIPMGTNYVPLVADLFLFFYERDFMKDRSNDNQADVIKAFNSTSRYLDDLLNTWPSKAKKDAYFSSPEPKAQGELIVYRSSRRLCVCVTGCVSVCLCVCGHFQTQISPQPVGQS